MLRFAWLAMAGLVYLTVVLDWVTHRVVAAVDHDGGGLLR
jgi:hypothetical protein